MDEWKHLTWCLPLGKTLVYITIHQSHGQPEACRVLTKFTPAHDAAIHPKPFPVTELCRYYFFSMPTPLQYFDIAISLSHF